MSIGRILKSRTSRHSHQGALFSARAGAFWIAIACMVWNWSAAGAEEPVLSIAGGPNSATDLKAEHRCDPVELTGIALLSWEPAETGGGQRLDVTMFRNGFQTGDFTTFGPLPSDQIKIALTSGDPGINYYWRVLTQTSDGWVPSATERLPWPVCPTNDVSPLGETDLRPAPDGVLEEFEEPEAPEDSEVFRDFEDSEGSEDFPELDDLGALEGVDDFESLEDLEALGSDAWGIEFEDVNPDQSSRYNDDPTVFASGGRVNGLASVPGNNRTFYAASEWGGLYRTMDKALRWERLDGHLPAATCDGGQPRRCSHRLCNLVLRWPGEEHRRYQR